MDKDVLALANQTLPTNLTGCQQLVQVLRSELDLCNTIINAASALVVVIDPQGHIVRCNRAWEQTTGYECDEVRNQPFWGLFLPENEQESVKAVFEKIQVDKLALTHEHNWITKDGSRRRIAWNYTPFLNNDSRVKYTIGTGADITECQQIDSEPQRLHEALKMQVQLATKANEQEKAATERIAELAKANEELRQRDRLVEATVMAANALLTVENFDKAVNTALQIIGEALDTDRVAVTENFRNSCASSVYWRVLYEWDSPHAVSQSHPDVAQGSWEGIETWYEACSRGQNISCLLEDIPEPFKSGQAQKSVKSFNIVPIFVEGKYWGNLGFDDCQEAKPRNSAELAVLRIAADCIGSAIQRARTHKALLQTEQARSQELERANNALQSTVAALAARCDLDGFIGEVLEMLAHEFESPLVEYWTVLGTDAVEINTWLYDNQLCSLKHNDEHPGRGGIRLSPEFINFEDFTRRSKPIVFTEPKPAYSLALDQVICPSEWYAARGVSEHFNFPLQAGNMAVGAISVWLPSDRQITEECLRLGQALSDQTALAIQLTQLADEAKQAALAKLNEVNAKEQEKAALSRAAELGKANEALRRTLDQLANDRNLDSFLSHILREAIQMLHGATAQLFLYDASSETITSSVGVDEQGTILPAPGLVAEVSTALSFPAEIWSGWTHLLKQRCPVYFDLERDRDYFLPEYLEYHRHQGHCGSVCTALMLGDEPLGFLGLVFRDRSSFSTCEFEFFQALAQQATLAIQLTRLSAEAEQAIITQERNRMAREIHDTLAQAFTGILVHQEAAKRLLAGEQEDVLEHISWTLELAREGLEEARRSVWALRSHTLTHNSLPDTLARVVEQMTSGLPIVAVFGVRGSCRSLPDDVESDLLRISQEAITNILKHARAQHVHIELIFEVREVRLRVQDDGRGFIPQPSSATARGFGLVGMQERTERLGGQLTITSQPRKGTEVVVTIPLLA